MYMLKGVLLYDEALYDKSHSLSYINRDLARRLLWVGLSEDHKACLQLTA